LIIGENYPIHWDWTGVFSNVKIEYTTDGGTNWVVITSSTPNDGEYIWTVPNAPSNQCKIRITNTSDPNSFAVTQNSFSIANNSVKLISPNGGEQYITGKYYPIYWEWSGSFQPSNWNTQLILEIYGQVSQLQQQMMVVTAG